MKSPGDLETPEELKQLLQAADEIIESKTATKQQKFNASFQVLAGINSFLRSNQSSVQRRPLMRILEELARIHGGSEPNLFSLEKWSKGGRPPRSPAQNANEALIVAGIEFLIDSGIKPKEALEKAKSLLGSKAPNLVSIRKSFKSRNRPVEYLDLMFRLKGIGLKEAEGNHLAAGIASLEKAKEYLK